MDRVSSLHDEILCRILSFLPTKQATVTSVLSKRWVNVWKLVPNLDIDDSVFLHPEDGKGEREEIRTSFVHFMDTILAMQGDYPVKKFSLKCINGVPPDCVNRWIHNVVQRGVSDLAVDVKEGYHLPEDTFASKTLVNLKLRSEHYVDWWLTSTAFPLPMLKSLDINSERLSCGDLDKFLLSFPVLEELGMAKIEWLNSVETIASASLKTLSIYAFSYDDYMNLKSVSFDTPNLLSLMYSDFVAEDYPLVNMNKLTEATINLLLHDHQVERLRAPNNDWIEDDVYDDLAVLSFGNVVKLMNGIQNVEKLSILSETLEVLSLCCDTMPVFNNLKFLGIKSEEGLGWQAMPVLLKNCPHLETIVLQGLFHHVSDKCGDACPCVPREDKGRSLTSCPVKRLEIQGFRATMKEMDIIKHFLDYFPCLKEMTVIVEEHEPTQLKDPQVCGQILKMFKLYNELSSCNVRFVVSEYLEMKWITEGVM